MYTVDKKYTILYTDKKSKFHSYIIPVYSEEDLRREIKNLKEEYPDAKHFCYGTRFFQGDSLIEKSSDHGEPNGTAGKPILNVLKSKEIIDAVVVVVRYFGGTLLGIPGLIHAYKHSAELVIEEVNIIEYKKYTFHKETIAIDQFDKWKYDIEKKGGIIIESSFGIVIDIEYKLPI